MLDTAVRTRLPRLWAPRWHDLAVIRSSRGCSVSPLPRGTRHPHPLFSPPFPILPESRSRDWPLFCPQMSLRCGCWVKQGHGQTGLRLGNVFSVFHLSENSKALCRGGWVEGYSFSNYFTLLCFFLSPLSLASMASFIFPVSPPPPVGSCFRSSTELLGFTRS